MPDNLLYVPRFTFDDAANACGRPVGTVRSWKNSDLLEFGSYDRPGRQGMAGLMSLATIYKIAIAAELMGYGLSPGYSMRAATAFAQVGNYEVQDVGDMSEPKGRPPAALFPEGQTLLIVWKPTDVAAGVDNPGEGHPDIFVPNRAASVVNVKMDDTYGRTLAESFFKVAGGRTLQSSFLVIDCNFLCQSVKTRLGISE